MASISVAQLRHNRGLATLAIVGVMLAVIFSVLLMSLGTSVIQGGQANIEQVGGDLWVTMGPTTFSPIGPGHVDHPIPNAHILTAEIADRDDVIAARAFAFQTVYASVDGESYDTITAAGVTGDGSIFRPRAGDTFSGGDTHYSGGSYDGPMSHEVLLDERVAERLGVDVGDSLYLGGTLTAAENNEFTVIGISNEIGSLVGTPTIVLHLGELQQVSGTTGTDPASAILIGTEDEPAHVQRQLEAAHPGLTVRTNHEQFEMILRQQAHVLVGAGTFLVVGLLGGVAIVANVFGLLVGNQRKQLAALRAIGLSRQTLVGLTTMQGVVIGGVASGIGILAVLPAIAGVNLMVEMLVGFEQLIDLHGWIFGLGTALALCISTIGAGFAGWWAVRSDRNG